MTDETPIPRTHHSLAHLSPERRVEIARLGGKKSRGGFRAMSPERRREVAAKGARRAHANGNAHEWDEEEARRAGRISHPPYRAAVVYRTRRGHVFQVQQEEEADA